MPGMRTSLLTATLSAVLLTRCAPPPDPVLVKPLIPASLLTCGERPAPPLAPTNAGLADFILDLAGWGDGCHDHLQRVKELLR